VSAALFPVTFAYASRSFQMASCPYCATDSRAALPDAVYTLATKPHRGSPHNPFSWDEICEKFRRYTREILSEEQAEAVIGGIAHLEQTADMAEIARLLAEP
jgi:hypothetical protein